MCRLLGITHFNYQVHAQIVQNFCQLARDGRVMDGDDPGHGDGWGVAYYQLGQATVHKSALSLYDEQDRLHQLLARVAQSPVLVLHLRKSAWENTTSTRHAHPFIYQNMVFAHNGTVLNYRDILLPQIAPQSVQSDALDTEVFFAHIVSSGQDDLASRFSRSISHIKPNGRYTALNCLLADETQLIAYRDFSKAPDYYGLYKARQADSWCIASEPLAPQLAWQLMAPEEMISIRV